MSGDKNNPVGAVADHGRLIEQIEAHQLHLRAALKQNPEISGAVNAGIRAAINILKDEKNCVGGIAIPEDFKDDKRDLWELVEERINLRKASGTDRHNDEQFITKLFVAIEDCREKNLKSELLDAIKDLMVIYDLRAAFIVLQKALHTFRKDVANDSDPISRQGPLQKIAADINGVSAKLQKLEASSQAHDFTREAFENLKTDFDHVQAAMAVNPFAQQHDEKALLPVHDNSAGITEDDVVKPVRKGWLVFGGWGRESYEFRGTVPTLAGHLEGEAGVVNAKQYWNYYWSNPNEFSVVPVDYQVKILNSIDPKAAGFPPDQKNAFKNILRGDDELRQKIFEDKQARLTKEALEKHAATPILGLSPQKPALLNDGELTGGTFAGIGLKDLKNETVQQKFDINKLMGLDELETYLINCYLSSKVLPDPEKEFLLQTLPPSWFIDLAKANREVALAVCKNPSLLSLDKGEQKKHLLAIYNQHPLDLEMAVLLSQHGVQQGNKSLEFFLTIPAPPAKPQFYKPYIQRNVEFLIGSEPAQAAREEKYQKYREQYVTQIGAQHVSAILAHSDNTQAAFTFLVKRKQPGLLQSNVLQRAAKVDGQGKDIENVRKLLFVEQNKAPGRDAKADREMAALLKTNSRLRGIKNRQITRRILEANPDRIIHIIRLAGSNDIADAEAQRKFATQLVNTKALYPDHSKTLYNQAFGKLATHIDAHSLPSQTSRWLRSVKKAFGRFKAWITGAESTSNDIQEIMKSDLLRGRCNFAKSDAVLKLLDVANLDPVICERIAMDRNLWTIVKREYFVSDAKKQELFAKHPIFFIQDRCEIFGVNNLKALKEAIAQLICGQDIKIKDTVIISKQFWEHYKGFVNLAFVLEHDTELLDMVVKSEYADARHLRALLTESTIILEKIVNDDALLTKLLPDSDAANLLFKWLSTTAMQIKPDVRNKLLEKIVGHLEVRHIAENSLLATDFAKTSARLDDLESRDVMVEMCVINPQLINQNESVKAFFINLNYQTRLSALARKKDPALVEQVRILVQENSELREQLQRSCISTLRALVADAPEQKSAAASASKVLTMLGPKTSVAVTVQTAVSAAPAIHASPLSGATKPKAVADTTNALTPAVTSAPTPTK